nr:hypothetical protein [Prescottella equi]
MADDGFSWALYEADGNAFALLSGVLLEILLSRLNRVRLSDLNTVDELASAYQAVVDPRRSLLNVPICPFKSWPSICLRSC